MPLSASRTPVRCLWAFLKGQWQFTRAIVDARASTTTLVEGTACWAADAIEDAASAGPVPAVPLALRYTERGQLLPAVSPPIETRAAYEWRLRPQDGVSPPRAAVTIIAAAADVHFEDGRFFHTCDLRSGACDVRHLCGADEYLGTFRALSEHLLEVTWRVRGPRKDYDSRTRYTRDSGESAVAHTAH